jgi:hypothetical protein
MGNPKTTHKREREERNNTQREVVILRDRKTACVVFPSPTDHRSKVSLPKEAAHTPWHSYTGRWHALTESICGYSGSASISIGITSRWIFQISVASHKPGLKISFRSTQACEWLSSNAID